MHKLYKLSNTYFQKKKKSSVLICYIFYEISVFEYAIFLKHEHFKVIYNRWKLCFFLS